MKRKNGNLQLRLLWVLAGSLFIFLQGIALIFINNIHWPSLIHQLLIVLWCFSVLAMGLFIRQAFINKPKALAFVRIKHLWRGNLFVGASLVITACILATMLAQILTTPVAHYYSFDNTVTPICAAQDVLASKDPYSTNEAQCLSRLHASIKLATPLANGIFQHDYPIPPSSSLLARGEKLELKNANLHLFPNFGYPPLSFVLLLPVANAPPKIISLYIFFIFLFFLAFLVKKNYKFYPVILLVVLLNVNLSALALDAATGNSQILGLIAIMLSALFVRRPKLFAISLAIGLATTQLGVIIALGYIPLVIKDLGQIKLRLFYLIGTLAILTIPWLIIYPNALHSIIALATGRLFPDGGIGFSEMMVIGVLPWLSKMGFELLFLSSIILSMGYGFFNKTWRQCLPAMILMCFWFNARSHPEYIFIIMTIALCLVLGLFVESDKDVSKPVMTLAA